MPTAEQLLEEAIKCDEAASDLYRRVLEKESLRKPYFEEGEQCPSPVSALGVLRRKAQKLAEQAGV
ncbi:MAG: hypothetical protein ACE5K2_06395 [Candidatus Zixiibacteriota bacterium]